jgi:hypothetical protein
VHCIAFIIIPTRTQPANNKKGKEKHLRCLLYTEKERLDSNNNKILLRFSGTEKEKQNFQFPLNGKIFSFECRRLFFTFSFCHQQQATREDRYVLIGAPIKNNNRRDEYAKEKRGRIHPLTS